MNYVCCNICSLATSIRQTGNKTQELSAELKENEKKKAIAAEVNQEELENQIARLIEERDTLMNAGAYTVDDKIIRELDKKIRDTLARQA